MKAKTFLLLGLLTCIGLIQLSAQNGKDITGAVSSEYVWDAYWQSVTCDNGVVDYLSGTATGHMVDFFKDGVWIWNKQNWSGEVKSIYTDEVFKVSAPNKVDGTSMITTWHFNLIGNKGSHYIGTMTMDWSNWPDVVVTQGKIICLENGRDK